MITLRFKLSLGLFVSLIGCEIACSQTQVEEVLPAIIELKNVVGNAVPKLAVKAPSLAVVIHIPASTVAKSLNRDFQNAEPVQREVLGTRSRGQAHCHGTVTCTLEENPLGAAFCCRIQGTVHSQTCGTNGPAIIHSQADTSYVALKGLVFNGTSFVSTPVTVNLNTELKITGIDSNLPALRGRIVRRVATKRAAESHAQAQAITTTITRDELSSRIDKEFDTRLNELNQKLSARLSLIQHFRSAGNEIFIRSYRDGIEIGLVTAPLSQKDIALHHVPIGESIELWLKGQDESAPAAQLAQMPALAAIIAQSPQWLAAYFSKSPQLSKLDDKTLKIKKHDNWLVIQLQD